MAALSESDGLLRLPPEEMFLELSASVIGSVVEAEGFEFFHKDTLQTLGKKSIDDCKNEILYLSSEMARAVGIPLEDLEQSEHRKRAGILFSCMGPTFELRPGLTRLRLTKWLRRIHDVDANECIICFETSNNNNGCFRCGCVVCMQCFLDTLLVNEQSDRFDFDCPNCRYNVSGIGCMDGLLNFACDLKPPFKGVKWNSALKRLVYKWTGYHGFGDMGPLRETRERIQTMRKDFADENERRIAEICGPSIKKNQAMKWRFVFHEIKDEILSLARDYAVNQCRHRCANCGKSFWDKKVKKKAPKCTKCKLAAYCNAKCRKAHRKTHAIHCGRKRAM